MYTKICMRYQDKQVVQIFVARNFHEFHKKISHRENIIVNILLLHISALIVGYFL